MISQAFETVIGLEVHAQLTTKSKLFCGCPTVFGATPNDQTCPVCLGMPGALPVLNRAVVDRAVRFGLAIGYEPAGTSIFARKNYFYPDLPKGYQISQYDHPVVGRGTLIIDLPDGSEKVVGITRAHLEEDAGQSVHDGMPQSRDKSYVNLNRAGIPLLEIVTDPDIHSAEEAYHFLQALKRLVQYLAICDGNMEEGSLRCDANVSIRPRGQATLGTRTELKNLNSFNNVRRAIQHEVDRQITIVTQGGQVQQCTLLWDADSQTTRIMRTKEDSHDYRYFPDPDLLPLVIEQPQVTKIQEQLPELPRARCQRFQSEYHLTAEDAYLLCGEQALADYFEAVTAQCDNPKASANWIKTELLREMKTRDGDIRNVPVPPQHLAQLIQRIDDRTISGKIAKDVLAEMVREGQSAEHIINARGLRQITDEDALKKVVTDLLANFPDQVAQYRGGKAKVFGFLVGQAMKATKGKANPALINRLLHEVLGEPTSES